MHLKWWHEECGNRRSRQELSKEYLVVQIGFDTEENGPFEVRDGNMGVQVTSRIRRNIGFPALRLFRGDPSVSVHYNGPRTADKMAKWARDWQSAEVLVPADPASPPSTGLVAAGVGDARVKFLAEAAAVMLNPRQPQSECNEDGKYF